MPSIRKMRAALDLRVEFFESGPDAALRSDIPKATHWPAAAGSTDHHTPFFAEGLPMPPAFVEHLRLLESATSERDRARAAKLDAEVLAMELRLRLREQEREALFAALEDAKQIADLAQRISELEELVARQADELSELRPGGFRLAERRNRHREGLAEALAEHVGCHSEAPHECHFACMCRSACMARLRSNQCFALRAGEERSILPNREDVLD